MEWTQYPYLPTVSGVDVVLWVAAYAVWRYLAGLGRARKTAFVATPVRTQQVVQTPVPRLVAGRWGQRAAMVQKLGGVTPREHHEPRKLRRAA